MYLNRASAYIGLINTSMILYLFLERANAQGTIDFSLEGKFGLVLIIGLFTMLFIGWFDLHVIKGWQQEARFSSQLNPVFMEMKGKVDYLYDKEKNG